MPVPRDRLQAATLLGVPIDAPQDHITDRYRTLAHIFHPDRNPDAPDASARMQELNVARDLLLHHREETAVVTLETTETSTASRRDEQRLAAVMHEMPYGVYFVGTHRQIKTADDPSGMIADWVLQVSFKPRLVLTAFERDSYSLASIQENRALTLCLLAEDCFQLAGRFLQPRDPTKIHGRSRPAGDAPRTRGDQLRDKLAGADYWTTDRGCPVLAQALTWLDCEAEQFIPSGDHMLVVSRVIDGDRQREADPLTSLNTGWNYSG